MLGRTIFNRYKIIEEVSRDPLTIIYNAQDLSQNIPARIKFFKEKARQQPLETLLRFKRELEQISKLDHPNLLKIYSQGEFEGQNYIIEEYFGFNTLSSFVKQPWNIDQEVEIILQVSSALDLCHQNGILHQAIQPQAILIRQGHKQTIAKLTNFGHNLLINISRITDFNEIISTFGYLSPESSGILKKPIDVRSDIYSLGILFYQLLTGQLPYKAQDVATLIYQHITQKPPSPSKLNNNIPSVIENIVLRLIAKDPQDRYQSLSGLITDLREYQKQRQEGNAFIDFEIARSDRLRQITFSTRLIGKEDELNQLKTLLDQAKKGKGNLCFVFGEPGSGKSRLVDELRGNIHNISGIFAGGKCYQYEFRTPYKVFSEAIDAYIEKVKRLSQQEQQNHIKRIKGAMGELGGEIVKIAPNITDLIGQPPKLVPLGPEKEKIRFLITITNFLVSLSSNVTPLLIFLDDIQWVDDGSLEILERLTEKLSNTPTLLIVSYRDTEIDHQHPLFQLIKRFKDQQLIFSAIPVKAFTFKETTQMIGQILMEKEEGILPLSENLHERAKGNPFFTLELLHSLVDSKIIYLKEDHYTYDLNQLKKASLPITIVEAVLNRIKGLNEDSLQILSYASVMGREIDFSLILELAQKPQDTVLNAIEDGIQNQILYRDITGRENIFFMHDRIKEAFYQRVPQEERIPLHKHIAEVIEEQNKDNPESVLYDLAHHFTQGKVEDKALKYSIPAAHKARASYANVLAISLYTTAKEILEKQDKTKTPEYIDVLENLGEVYRLAGRFEESLKVLKACEALIVDQDIIHKAMVLSKIGDTLWDNGKVEESAKVLEQALRILGIRVPTNKIGIFLGIGQEFTRQILHYYLPKIFVKEKYISIYKDIIIIKIITRIAHAYYFSDMNTTFYFYLKALNLSEKIGPCPELAYNYISGGPVWVTFPWFSRAFMDLSKGLKMAQDLGDKIKEGCAYSYLSYTLYLANKPKEGFEYAQKGINILKNLGEYWDLGVAYVFRGYNNFISGRLREAIKDNEEYILNMKEANVLQPLGWALYQKGKLYSLLGEIDENLINEIKESNRLMKLTRDKADEMWSLFQLAFTYLRKGANEKAIKRVEEGIKLFPTHYNRCPWVLDLFSSGAQAYLDTVANAHDLPEDKKKQYLKRASWFCKQSFKWGRKFQFFLGWTYQVNGTYNWLIGKKRKAIKLWEKGIKFIREKTEDKYRLAYLLLEEAKFLLQDNPRDKKAYEYLIEARDLFSSMGCKLDLVTTNKLMEGITPQEETVDSRQVLTQKRHLDFLLSVTQAIGSIFVLEELLDRIMEYSLKVTGAERGFLLLYDPKDNTLKLKLCRGMEKDLEVRSFSYENYRISLELIKEIEGTKTAIIADPLASPNPKISDELKAFHVRQAIAVPLRTRGKPLGVLYLDNLLAGGMFSQDELELMKSFAVQASVSIDNAYLVANLVEQERLKHELELGRQIQMSLLPQKAPEVEGITVQGFMEPAQEIGGDYYDFIPITGEKLAIVIGDVSGKGVAAGLLMAMAKTAIHTISRAETSPRQILLRTNQILYQHIEGQKFITMLYMQWDSVEKKLRYSSAGHEHIIVYRPQSKNSVEVIKSGGFVLGMMPEISQFIEDNELSLSPGDKVILYTDGITDARNNKEEMFGLERLIEIVARHGHKDVDQLLTSIKDETYNFVDNRKLYDDITIVTMEINPVRTKSPEVTATPIVDTSNR